MLLANNTAIAISVGVVIVGSIIAVFVLKAMKGKLTLTLEKRGFNTNETITGTLRVELKKGIETRRLFVALNGYEERKSRDSDGEEKTERQELYRGERNLLVDETWSAGQDETYSCEIPTPTDGGSGGGWLGGVSIQLGDLQIGVGNTRMHRMVEARLDTPGLDLTSSQRIKIND